MADRATESLKHILESGEYAKIDGVPIFDEHSEFDKKGNLLRKFSRTELQHIADACNNRERTTGDLSPLGPGHTRDDVASEEDQPAVFGYARNYRVGTFGPEKKLGLLCDWHVQKRIRTKSGQTVDGVEYAKSFPRRSVELWPDSMTIDWIALLRRSPMRDLGLLAYSRDSHTVSYSPRREVVGMTNSKGKLRYSMEASKMPDNAPNPVDNPNAADDADLHKDDDAPPEGHEEFAKHLDYAMKNHPALKYAADQCASSMKKPGEEGDVDDAKKPDRMQRGGDVQKSAYQRQIDETKAEIAQLKYEKKMLGVESQLRRFQDEDGIILDLDDELKEFGPLGEKEVDKRFGMIRKNYARGPVGGDLPPEAIERDPGNNPLEKHAGDIIKYMRENNITGEGAFYRAAKEKGLIK